MPSPCSVGTRLLSFLCKLEIESGLVTLHAYYLLH